MKFLILASILILSMTGLVGMQESFATEPCGIYSEKEAWDRFNLIYFSNVTSKSIDAENIYVEFEITEILKGKESMISLNRSFPIINHISGYNYTDSFPVGTQLFNLLPNDECGGMMRISGYVQDLVMKYVNQQRELPTPEQQTAIPFENFECKFDLLPVININNTFECVSKETKELLLKQNSIIEFDYYKLLDKSVQLEHSIPNKNIIVSYWSSTGDLVPLEYKEVEHRTGANSENLLIYTDINLKMNSEIKGRFLVAIPNHVWEILKISERNLYSKEVYQDKINTIFEINYLSGESFFSIDTRPVRYDGTEDRIPSWIKNNAGWWASGQLDDNHAFTQGIQWLILNGDLKDPFALALEDFTQIPDWVKNIAEWWADDSISEDEFLSIIQFLMNTGVIRIS